MPPKASKSLQSAKRNEAAKQDLDNRVKEIKLRQQNWLKQENISNGECIGQAQQNNTEPVAFIKPCGQSTNSSLAHKPASNDFSKQPKGFAGWLVRRAQDDDDDCSVSRCSTNSTALNMSSMSDDIDDDDDTAEIEAVADQIVLRVKQEMKAFDNKDIVRLSSPHIRNDVDLVERKNVQLPDMNEVKHPDSHYCKICHQLMLPPKNSPVLVVPCGDTVCSKCTNKVERCPLCCTLVQSKTCHIMLQQIVEQYHRDNTFSSLEHTKHSSKQQRKNNLEEYNNLKMRCEILDEEQKEISMVIKQLDFDKRGEEKQIESIKREQHKLENQIEKLRERQQTLEMHKVPYIKNCNEIDERKKEEQKKLSLLQITLADLQQELKKFHLEKEATYSTN